MVRTILAMTLTLALGSPMSHSGALADPPAAARAADVEPARHEPATHESAMRMKKLSPIIAVESVEECIPFWTARLGFEMTVSVPHNDTIGFAILQRNGVEIMYQSRASIDADIAGSQGTLDASELVSRNSILFIEVEKLDPVVEALEGAEVVVARRRTFYGMDEIFVRSPCGTVVGFAAQVEEEGPEA